MAQQHSPNSNQKSGMSGRTKGCLGCLGIGFIGFIGIMIVGMMANNDLKDDFVQNKTKIISDMNAAIDSGNYVRAIEIGEPYRSVGDYEYKEIYHAAKKVVDKARTEERAARKAAAEVEKAEEQARQEAVAAEKKATDEASAAASASPASIGESFRLGKFSYTITSARKTNHIGGSDIESALVDLFSQGLEKELGVVSSGDSAVYLIVRYRIKNEGTESAVVSTMDFTVEDAKGRKFTTSSDATTELVLSQGADFLLSELQPGIGTDAVQAFQLPNDAFAGELTLLVPEKGLLSSGEKRVKLK